MFCSNSHQNIEKELHDLKLTTINNPSKCDSILKSFLNELNFFDRYDYIDTIDTTNVNYDNTSKEYFFINKQKNISTMKEAEEGNDDKSTSLPKNFWKSAVDPISGKKYYYDAVTRKTQWNKPAKLKAREKRKKKEQMRIARIFFNEMEENVLDSIARGEVVPGIPFYETKDTEMEGLESTVGKSHIRTISRMHGVLVAELGDNPNEKRQDVYHDKATIPKVISQKRTKRNSALIAGRPPLPGARSQHEINSSHPKRARQKDFDDDVEHPQQGIDERLVGEKLINNKSCEVNKLEVSMSSTGHTRRNTGGTIYLQNSMTNPNIKATIRCVCAVFRAHIAQSKDDRRRAQKFRDYDVFDDNCGSSKRRRLSKVKVPTLMEILEFYEAFYQRSQMEHDTIITSLIYVERVIKLTNGILVPTMENWRSFLFACMVLASKVWDDLSMWNIDFSNVTAHTAGLSSFTLPRINELELALLKCLKFDVTVPASEYAKYYFLIRTMLLRSGLVKEDEKPLGKREAFQKLESLSSPYFDQCWKKESRDRRSKSMDGSIFTGPQTDELYSGEPVLKDSVCLEQLVN